MSENDAGSPETEIVPADAGEPAGQADDEVLRSAIAFVREHPGVAIAGGIAAGFVAGALFPKRAAGRLARRAVEAAGEAGALGLVLGRQAWDRSDEAVGSDARKDGDAGAEPAEPAGQQAEPAAGHTAKLIGSAEQLAAAAVRSIAEKALGLRSRIRH